ncbi:ABC transporter ATP-binding protein [Seohaeicola saemankumensis]|nr:ABC transporter ATP-binding protein [Seohaeicola saemankumensis]MCA0873445.1 ABC transporter ATP-binding protein [Seohaeicola saemankumensis]
MIELRNLTKVFTVRGRQKVICDNINLQVPARTSVALLGRNGAGKSTLLKILAGNMEPTSGEILCDGTISWPVGFSGSFHPDLTGSQNTKFIARIYGIDTTQMSDFVEDFAEIGQHYHLPVRTYSSGMRSRLAFGVSMAVPFDYYLVDEATATGDASFRAKSNAVFLDRMQNAGSFVVSHSMKVVRELCDIGMVLENGQATIYEDLEEAIAKHEENMLGAPERERMVRLGT